MSKLTEVDLAQLRRTFESCDPNGVQGIRDLVDELVEVGRSAVAR